MASTFENSPTSHYAGLAFILTGIALSTLRPAVTDGGFWGGAMIGAALALIIGGTYILGRVIWRRRDTQGNPEWLPSQDGPEPQPGSDAGRDRGARP